MNASGGSEHREVAVLLRKLEQHPTDQLRAEDVADDRADEKCAQTDEQSVTQLLEVLDERGSLLAVVEAARGSRGRGTRGIAPLGETGSASRSLPAAGAGGAAASGTLAGGVAGTGAGGGRAAATASGLSPVTESLNSLMPVPSERPISGNRLAPKSNKMTRSSKIRCNGERSDPPIAVDATKGLRRAESPIFRRRVRSGSDRDGPRWPASYHARDSWRSVR